MPPSSVVEAFSITHAQVLDGSTSFIEAALAQSVVPEDQDIYGVNNASLSPDADSYDNEGDDTVMSTWDWLNKAELEIQAGYLSFPLIANMTGREVDEVTASIAANAVQTITVTATAGTFTLTFDGDTTGDIAYNASNSTVQTALEGLDGIGTGDVAVTGSTGTYVLTFGGALAGRAVALIVVDDEEATGGTVTIANTTVGYGAISEHFGLDLWHEDSFNTAPKPAILVMPSKDKLGAVRRLTIGLYKVQFAPIGFDGPEYKDGLKVNMNGNALLSAFDETGQPFSDGKRRVGRLLSHA